MRRHDLLTIATAAGLLAGCAPAESADQADADAGPEAAAPAGAQEAALPPGAEGASAALDDSPRHGEWVRIETGEGDSVRAWVVHPERDDAAPVVLVVHEIFGLTGWIRAVADQVAAEGFLAIAPDLLSGRDIPTGEGGDPERDAAVEAVRALEPDEVHRRLQAVAAWGTDLPSTTNRYGIVGFCWGGSTSFAHATRVPELGAAVVYYGSSPDSAALAGVEAPVLGLYGGDDERVNATVPPADSVMRQLGKTYEVRTYEGAGHGFLRQQEGREGANRAASEEAWPETIRWFRTHLEEDAPAEGA